MSHLGGMHQATFSLLFFFLFLVNFQFSPSTSNYHTGLFH